MKVNEIFGPTIQGEGVNMGKPCMFLRLAGCNLHCTWCDTKYSWDWKHYSREQEEHDMHVEDVARNIKSRAEHLRHLVITGGEPLLQQGEILELRERLPGWYVEIETNGTISPGVSCERLASLFTVSPKLSNSGNDMYRSVNEHVLKRFASLGYVYWKFVATCLWDLREIRSLQKRLQIPTSRIYIMPEGIAADKMAMNLAVVSMCIKFHYNITTRLQVILYGNKRAV